MRWEQTKTKTHNSLNWHFFLLIWLLIFLYTIVIIIVVIHFQGELICLDSDWDLRPRSHDNTDSEVVHPICIDKRQLYFSGREQTRWIIEVTQAFFRTSLLSLSFYHLPSFFGLSFSSGLMGWTCNCPVREISWSHRVWWEEQTELAKT